MHLIRWFFVGLALCLWLIPPVLLVLGVPVETHGPMTTRQWGLRVLASHEYGRFAVALAWFAFGALLLGVGRRSKK